MAAAAPGLAARLERAGLRMVHPALGLAALGAAPHLFTLDLSMSVSATTLCY